MSFAAVIAWIAANPEIIAMGETAVVNMVQAVIDAWNRHKQGELTDAQLQAEWEACGVRVQAAIDAWNGAGNR